MSGIGELTVRHDDDVIEGGFPRDPANREASRAIAQAKTRAEYIAALVRRDGLSEKDVHALADYVYPEE